MTKRDDGMNITLLQRPATQTVEKNLMFPLINLNHYQREMKMRQISNHIVSLNKDQGVSFLKELPFGVTSCYILNEPSPKEEMPVI